MILASRQIPRLAIKHPSTESFSTSSAASPAPSQLSFARSLEAPPPSPGPPSPYPRERVKFPIRRYQRLARSLFWICSIGIFVFTTLQLAFGSRRSSTPIPSARYMTSDGQEYEIIGDSLLPQEPSPVAITDENGKGKWTISIPPTLDFPLRPQDYADICTKWPEVAGHAAGSKHSSERRLQILRSEYDHIDPLYVDALEAERKGILPWMNGVRSSQAQRLARAADKGQASTGEGVKDLRKMGKWNGATVCEKSLTFVLETDDAGMGNALMALWLSYGLAQAEGRAFFIDDTRWSYGRYTTYFSPPPAPSCIAPPRTQIVPCPHQARHILVSAATASWTWGEAFRRRYEDGDAKDNLRHKKIFSMVRQGYETLFQLRTDDQAYAEQRKATLAGSQPRDENKKVKDGMVIGTHIRRGDRHPFASTYQASYIPLDRYATTAAELLNSTFENTKPSRSDHFRSFEQHSTLLLASDDPEVYTAPELSNMKRAQDRIQLASKATLSKGVRPRPAADLDSKPQSDQKPSPPSDDKLPASPAPSKPVIDTAIGWEGGFYAGLFWSLGSSGSTAEDPTRSASQPEADAEQPAALDVRQLVGRAYLLDLKMLGEASDAVVCAASAVACRLLAVMMGWDAAFERHAWLDVDAGAGWWAVS